MSRIDDQARAAICAKVELHELIGRSVPLKRTGAEYQARCPFHNEKSPSFTVSPLKGFYHCFGCGAHGDAITWLIEFERMEFVDACRLLDDKAFDRLPPARAVPPAALPRTRMPEGTWIPLHPVPAGAPELMASDGRTVEIWNPKPNDRHPNGRFVRYQPSRVDTYRDAEGRVLGHVLRLDIEERATGKVVKITPTITWCIGPDGTQQWCVQHFRKPRPLYGLDALAAKPSAPVLVVEGEKCRAAGAGALGPYAVVSWPGGGNGVRYVDWSPLKDRDVVLWPDADPEGWTAMVGDVDHSGAVRPGVAQHLRRIGARSTRIVDTRGVLPKGWDLADALDEGWTSRQLAAWAAARVMDIEIEVQPGRAVR